MDEFEGLRRAVETVDVDTDTLIATAIQRGRRHRLRSRAATAAGVFAVGAFALVVTQGGALPGHSPHTVADDPTGQPGLVHHRLPSAEDGALPTAQQAGQHLASLLPGPSYLVGSAAYGDAVTADRTFDPDGTGAALVQVSLSTSPALTSTDIGNANDKCDRVNAAQIDSERCERVPNGWLWLYTGRPDVKNVAQGALANTATLVSTDGSSVSVTSANYLNASEPRRPAPSLSIDQVKQAALDNGWFGTGGS